MLAPDQLRALAPEADRSALARQALAADPWQFVPAAAAKLAQPGTAAPLAAEIRLATALALARLGLRTPALESLIASQHPSAPRLEQAIEALPSDTVALDERIATCRLNLTALRSPDRDRLEAAFVAWCERQSHIRSFRTGETTVLQRDDGRWLLFADDAAMAAAIDTGAIKGGPCYVDGFHAPAALRRLLEGTQPAPTQASPRLILLAGSEHEGLTSLSLRPMADVLTSARVEAWCGPDCPLRVYQSAEHRIECALGVVIALPSPPADGPRWAKGAIGEQLARARSLRDHLVKQVRARVDHWNAAFDARAVFASTRRDWRGLRVLLPTSRFTTYVQHAASDLADAFQRLGCATLVLKEPDEHATLTPLAFARAVDSFRPDMVVFINTLRSQIPDAAPARVPVVTWVQDAMTHLFSESAGSSMTERDFVVGHLHPELFDKFSFPTSRTLSSVVLASEAKFFSSPVGPSLRDRFACEVAYVSHQSQTPRELAELIVAREPDDRALAHCTWAALPRVVACVEQSRLNGPSLLSSLREIAVQTLVDAGSSAPGSTSANAARFLHQVVHPLAERVFRQQMIGWAADLCDARGWRLHLYGKGWERSPRFARFAKGELAHGEELRAAYQCAAMHLHAGLGGPHHQRVLECALSGGCTLVRIKSDDARLLEWWAQNELTRTARPEQFSQISIDAQTFFMTPVADHWQAMMAHAAMDRLGVPQQHPHRGLQAVSTAQLHEAPTREAVPLQAAWLMGDPSETAFWSQESFERAASNLIESSPRRASLSAWQRDATKTHFSLEAFAEKILTLVSDSLRPAPAMSRSG
jgi:hypothetical protein